MSGEMVHFDDVLDALGDIQRRKLLIAILEHKPQSDTPAVVGETSAEIDEVETRLEMRHVHLPKLVDYGFIEWDEDTHEVKKGPKFAEIRPLLKLLHNHEDELPEGWI